MEYDLDLSAEKLLDAIAAGRALGRSREESLELTRQFLRTAEAHGRFQMVNAISARLDERRARKASASSTIGLPN